MSWLDKNQNKILIAIWSAIFLTCFFVIFTDPVYAAAPSFDLPLTIGIPDSLSDLGVDSNIVESVKSQYFSILAVYSFDPSDNFTIFCESIDDQGNIYITATYNLEITNSSAITTDYLLTYRNLSQHFVQFVYNSNSGVLSSGNFYGGYIAEWQYFSKQTMAEGKGWVLDSAVEFPSYWVFSSGVVDDSGHASPPVDDSGHYIEDGNGNRIPKPNKPTPTPFTPPSVQFPSVDISSLETLLESLIDVVEYGFNYIGGVINGWFSNLLSNLDSWFDYVVQSFNYAVNNIVGAIKDLAQTFYNNMVSLFEPLYDFFSGIASFFNHLIEIGTVDGAFNLANIVTYLFLPDASAIYPIFVSHDEFNIIGITNHLFDEYRTMMSSVENINTLHYIMIPSFTFHGQTVPQTRIDFSWFENYKVYTDGIISAFLIVGYIYFLFTRISGWLRGNQGDIYVGDNSSNYHGTKIGF